jgi:hypothetical protein
LFRSQQKVKQEFDLVFLNDGPEDLPTVDIEQPFYFRFVKGCEVCIYHLDFGPELALDRFRGSVAIFITSLSINLAQAISQRILIMSLFLSKYI